MHLFKTKGGVKNANACKGGGGGFRLGHSRETSNLDTGVMNELLIPFKGVITV